ncbi:hypothetical protein GT360_17770 [Vibrio astriarenae]|uniref:Uncharacterized protein n=1 Tax=Vibrio astriarenae TaxID=1481923 RepID=A0A7Z2YFE2_9VIBR|nr:hypothetical protein [Vibrio astriarenae]QIA65388.1 hypothetical protein GT360_17770 [Vibrio astriarenae]
MMTFTNEEAVYEHFLPGYFHEKNNDIRNEQWWNATDEVITALLTELQKFRGAGDDAISLLCLAREGGEFIAWPDLLSHDIPQWRVQSHLAVEPWDEYALKLEEQTRNPRYISEIPKGYRSEYCETEVQLIYKDVLHNGLLSSGLHYIEKQATSLINEWAASRPHNQRAINLAWHDNANERQTFLESELEAIGLMTCVIENQTKGQLPEVHFVLANHQTMRNVRPKHLVRDIESMQCETPALLDTLVSVVVRVHKERCLNQGL